MHRWLGLGSRVSAVAYRRVERISLREHPILDERWVQDRLEADPGLLNLGELRVLAREKRVRSGGRLDLLLVDDEAGIRYEVECQLGPTDETHIIRALEYWDLERRRYPHFEHVAVLVAEDITHRFHNVINLFAGSVPIIAVQVAAFDLGDGDTGLMFTTVLDAAAAAVPDDDDDDEAAGWTRGDWVESSSPEMMELLDRLVEMLRGIDPAIAPKYNAQYIGLATADQVTNFTTFVPKRQSLAAQIKLPKSAVTDERITDAGLDQLAYDKSFRFYRIRLVDGSLDDPDVAGLLTDMFTEARDVYRKRFPARFPGRSDDGLADLEEGHDNSDPDDPGLD